MNLALTPPGPVNAWVVVLTGQGTITVPGCVSACPVEVPLEVEPQGGVTPGAEWPARGRGVLHAEAAPHLPGLLSTNGPACHLQAQHSCVTLQ